jgi:site-specific DNA-cytosine methylase
VVGEARIDNGTWAIADPRSCQGASFADPRMPIISLAGATPLPSLADKSPIHAVIEAGDGTWHRPMTTMELFALQGFEPGDETGGWLVLDGKSERGWRKRIGNAVPPPAAKAVAASCIRTLIACAAGGLLLSGERVWVKGRFDLDARWS